MPNKNNIKYINKLAEDYYKTIDLLNERDPKFVEAGFVVDKIIHNIKCKKNTK